MRRRWSKTIIIAMVVLGIVLVVLWRIYYPPTLAPFHCTPLPATLAMCQYTLQMDGTTPVISTNPWPLWDGSPSGALMIFCSPRGDPEITVPSPLSAKEQTHDWFGQVAWSAHHRSCAILYYVGKCKRIYCWQDGQWLWSVLLPGPWQNDLIAYNDLVLKPFDDGIVLCCRKQTMTGEECFLAGNGQILTRAKLHEMMQDHSSEEYRLCFNGEGVYCYQPEGNELRKYRLQLQNGRLICQNVGTSNAQEKSDVPGNGVTNGQSLFSTIEQPGFYYDDPMADRLARRLPFVGKQCAAFRIRQRCKNQGLYEVASSSTGGQHALFHLSGVYHNKEYRIIDACLLPDGHTILALADNNNREVLLRYHL